MTESPKFTRKRGPISTHPLFKGVRRPHPRGFHKAFVPYALEIGYLSQAWNQLHEQLCSIFCQIVSPENSNIASAIWQSVPSDRTQRKMLEVAYLAPGAINKEKHLWAIDDIRYLLKEAETLANQRNDAIHAPFRIGYSPFDKEFDVSPDVMQNNKRAWRFIKSNPETKDILAELVWYRSKANILYRFGLSIWFHLRQTAGSSPQRPQMPALGVSPSRPPPRRKNKPGSVPPQPPSSAE